MNKIGSVYRITSPTNRIYIGSSSNIKKRFSDYKCYDCKSQRKLYNSLKKYGFENHIFDIIWQGNIEEMLNQEVIFGLQFNVLSQENLNCKLPKVEDIFICISEETRLKMKNSHKKRFELMPKEKRDKLGWQKRGKKMSRKAIEHRTKLRQKPIIQEDLEGNFIKEWESSVIAGSSLKISSSDICQCCKNKKKTCGGFKWKYLNQELENSKYKQRKPRNNNFNKNKKSIIQMDLKDNFIKEWDCISDAYKFLNIKGRHISSCCNGKRKSTYGFKWKYKL